MTACWPGCILTPISSTTHPNWQGRVNIDLWRAKTIQDPGHSVRFLNALKAALWFSRNCHTTIYPRTRSWGSCFIRHSDRLCTWPCCSMSSSTCLMSSVIISCSNTLQLIMCVFNCQIYIQVWIWISFLVHVAQILLNKHFIDGMSTM